MACWKLEFCQGTCPPGRWAVAQAGRETKLARGGGVVCLDGGGGSGLFLARRYIDVRVSTVTTYMTIVAKSVTGWHSREGITPGPRSSSRGALRTRLPACLFLRLGI